MAVVVVEAASRIRPANPRAIKLFERESLRNNLLKSCPSHPLSEFLAEVLEGRAPEGEDHRVIEFPTGNAYRVEVSDRSQKGAHRLLVLLLQPFSPGSTDHLLERWQLTARESELATRLCRGQSTEEICAALDISAETFKTHMRNLLAKAGCRNRTDLVTRLLR